MDIIEAIGYAWCVLAPTFVIGYLLRDCWITLLECNEIEDEEDF